MKHITKKQMKSIEIGDEIRFRNGDSREFIVLVVGYNRIMEPRVLFGDKIMTVESTRILEIIPKKDR